jgi:hypothetical protein
MISLYKPSGREQVEHYPKAASEAFAFNDLVGLNTSGYLTKYLDGSSFPMLGLIQKTIAATDTDYASNTRVPVQRLDSDSVVLCDVSTGTAAQTDVGEYIDVDDQNSVDVGASTNNDFYVVGFISATQVLCKPSRLLGRVVE